MHAKFPRSLDEELVEKEVCRHRGRNWKDKSGSYKFNKTFWKKKLNINAECVANIKKLLTT
jgi:hypothetical protein